MPKPALSLFGFFEKEKAFEYLQKVCLVGDSSQEALLQHFQCAQSGLGSAIIGAGSPEIGDLPVECQSYCQAVLSSPDAQALASISPISIRLVEIAPLLAFQHHIELERAENLYCSTFEAPSIEEMLSVCLPLSPQSLPWEFSEPQSPNSWTIRTPSFNLRAIGGGLFTLPNGESYFGVKVAGASPFVWVIQFEGRSYLNNGYHRGFSLGKVGAKYMPCIFQEVQSLNGITNPNFPIEVLQSENPPTLGHYVYGRAYPINLRNYRRYMQTTYAEHLFYED